jgi:hypothetical protein
LGGMQVDGIGAADYALLGTNYVRLSWFDPQQALLSSREWMAVADQVGFDPLLLPVFNANYELMAKGSGYTLYRQRPGESLLGTFIEMYHPDLTDSPCNYESGRIVFLGDTIPERTAVAEELVVMTLLWQGGEPQPVKKFVHLTDGNNNIVTQWDGLGVAWEGWRQRQFLIQVQRLAVPADIPAGEYELWDGLYDSETLERWCGTRTLGSITVTNGE